MELRERVAKAIHESNRIVPWDATSQQDLAFERGDAALAAVLDAMQEPSEAMLDIMHEVVRIQVDPAARSADIQNDRAVWQAMLAAFRTEALPPDSRGGR